MPTAGDIMVTGVGTLGKCYIVQETDKFYYKDYSVLCVKNINIMNPFYFKYFMESQFMKDQINSNSSCTTVATLTMKRFNEYIFLLPPLEEQKSVVEKLDQILPMIDALEKDEIKLEEIMTKFPDNMKASILQSWCLFNT
jgi:type I restriction enzyme S subunit